MVFGFLKKKSSKHESEHKENDSKENELEKKLSLTRSKSNPSINEEKRSRRASMSSIFSSKRESSSSPVRRTPSRQAIPNEPERKHGEVVELDDEESDDDDERDSKTAAETSKPLDDDPNDTPEARERKRDLMRDSYVTGTAAVNNDEDDGDDDDEETSHNTQVNAEYQPMRVVPVMTLPGEGPNFVVNATHNAFSAYNDDDSGKVPVPTDSLTGRPKLDVGRVEYKKNRACCRIQQGDVSGFTNRRRFVVGVDMNQESFYALQWAIGAVIRDGDELYVRSILETDTKFDVERHEETASDRKNRMHNQKLRQSQLLLVSRKVTNNLEKTALNCVVECECIHAKDARYALLDEIKIINPLIVIVGTRGLKRMRRILLGGVSNSIVQNSIAPVMVVRRPMKQARTVRKPMAIAESDLSTSPANDYPKQSSADSKNATTNAATPSAEKSEPASSQKESETTQQALKNAAPETLNDEISSKLKDLSMEISK